MNRRVRALLDELVVDGQLEPGDRLPTERELAGSLGASRGAVRRALQGLQGEGRISRTVGRGTFLTEPAPQAATLPVDVSPVGILQARLALEPPLAALAADAARQVDVDRLSDLLAAEARTNTLENTETADVQIHRAVAAATHNDLLTAAYGVLHDARDLPVWGSLKRRTTTAERRAGYHAQHVEIVSAIADRDPAAAHTAMTVHLRALRDDLLGS